MLLPSGVAAQRSVAAPLDVPEEASTMSLPIDLRELQWLAPWAPTDAPLEEELRRELGPGHVLAGRAARAVARRSDDDDVLFLLPDGPAPLAVVHLTWQGSQERDARWPATRLLASVEEFVAEVMRPDSLAFGARPPVERGAAGGSMGEGR